MTDDKYIFFLDIDGTLVSDGQVPQKNKTAIALARKQGHKVFINTARSFAMIQPFVKELPADGFVAALGCSIHIGGERVYSAPIKTETAAEVYDYFLSRGRHIMIESEDEMIVESEFYPGKATIITSGKELLGRYPGEIIAKFYLPHDLSPEEAAFASERFLFFQHPSYAEFSQKGHTKATGIEYIASYYGVSLKRCVAMGDSLNDADMLKKAGIAVAMGDGVDELKQIADIVTCPAAEGGVAEAIYRIIGISPP